MATLKALSLTFTILYLFDFSAARIRVPLNVQPENDVTDHFPRSTSKKTILLPAKKYEPSDQVINVELEPEVVYQPTKSKNYMHILSGPTPFHSTKFKNDEHISSEPTLSDLFNYDERRPFYPTPFDLTKSKHDDHIPLEQTERETESTKPMIKSGNNKQEGSGHDLPVKEHHESEKGMPIISENAISIETLHLNPSNYVRIRPINGHFRVKPSLFRIPRCRHHHQYMNLGYQKQHQIPYGNDMNMAEDDMILDGQTIERFDPSVLHISTHSAPTKRPRTHHHHHHDEDDKMMMRHPFRQYIAKQKLKKQVEEEIQKRKEMDARKGGGFMKSFRKFLNHF